MVSLVEKVKRICGYGNDLRPPFNRKTAERKVKGAQALWNTKDPEKVVLAYTEDTIWRNRDQFLHGRDEVKKFLVEKWKKEKDYRLRKELFAYKGDKITAQFWYEYYDESKEAWFRCYGIGLDIRKGWTYEKEAHERE